MPAKDINKNSRNIVPSINKAIDILMLLSENPNMTFKDISKTLGLPVSTCYNILTTLESRVLIEKNKMTGEYNLGLSLMRLGLQVYNQIDIRKIALPYMKELTLKYDETSYLTIINHSTLEGIVLEKVESLRPLLVLQQVGSIIPLYASATGKSLLSGFSQEELNRYFQTVQLIPFSYETITDESHLRDELDAIRQLGYAKTINDLGNGVIGISSPIKDYQGIVIAAVSLAGPTERMKDLIPSIIPDVQQTGEKISSSIR